MSAVENPKQNNVDLIYPDQLNIIIRTSIPGYQKIQYKPSMTIKDSDENDVRFNPLIKLNQSVINKMPQEYRVKQFFNKGLFESLLIQAGSKPVNNVIQATRNGNVDNNINVTLNSIFPVGSVIYIGKSPYVITDHQWTSGDWKIEVKQKKQEIDPSNIKDPQLYIQLVRDEIISGEEQLNQLPSSILVGANYSDAPPREAIASTEQSSSEETNTLIEESPIEVVTLSARAMGPPTATGATSTQIEQKEDVARIPPPRPPRKHNAETTKVTEPTITLTNEELTMFSPKQQSSLESLSFDAERLFEMFKQYIQISDKSTSFFRNYFQDKSYKNVVHWIFSKFSKQLQSIIQQFYIVTTNSKDEKIDEWNDELYAKLCDQVSILKSPSNGDCFFKAVADGINIYNYENQDSKITYANYGIKSLFTTIVLREIVFRYIEELDQKIINDMLLIAEEQVYSLNRKFKESIEKLRLVLNIPHITREQYFIELTNIYNANPNFMIYKPTIVPIDINQYENPFRVLNKSEIKNYITSKDYWANEVAIEAICDKLQISIIPIDKYNYKSSSNSNRLKTLLTNNQLTKEHCSKKIMFLFCENNHYELIRFTYFTNPRIKLYNKDKHLFHDKWYTIFRNDGLAPPIHILMLIYGTIYSTLNELYKNDFAIYKPIMKEIDKSVSKLFLTKEWNHFSKEFDNVFPNKITIESRIKREYETNRKQIENQEEQIVPIKGGESTLHNDSIQDYITKKPDEQGRSKIAYAITIDMELQPGTSLTPEQISKSKCNSKYNAIRKAYSEFTGKPYVIAPVYTESKNNTMKNVKGGRRKTRKGR